MTITDLWQTITTAVASHRDSLLLAALTLAVIVVVGAAWKAHRNGRIDRWVSALAWVAAFGFSAEGMWMVATQKAHVPPVVAVGVFFVAEAFQVSAMLQAARRYALDGHPGKHGRAVWIIAVAAGAVVAFAAHNSTEALLRFLIPLGAALLWWNTLTDAGMTKPQGRWRWTPSRLLEWAGAIEPDVDRDLGEVARSRQVAAMVTARLGVEDAGPLRWWHARRLRGLAKAADEQMVDDVRDRVGRVLRIVELTVPLTTQVTSPVTAEVTTAEDVTEDRTEHLSLTSAEHITEDLTEDITGTSPTPAADPSVKTSPKPNATAVKIARLRAKHPTSTQAEIAKKASVSLATTQRYWRAIPAADEPAKTNGHAVPDLIANGGTS